MILNISMIHLVAKQLTTLNKYLTKVIPIPCFNNVNVPSDR